MKIKQIEIKNFRGIRDLSLDFSDLTILIGENGVGKSTILKALEFFKEENFNLKIEDYYNRDLSKKIEVGITFSELTDIEKDEFRSYLDNDELRVLKIAKGDVETNNPKASQKYHGFRFQHKGFLKIRNANSKTEQKELYIKKRDEEKYRDLPSMRMNQSADLIENYLQEWERNHSNEIEKIIDAGQFFGWKGVGKGKLNKYLEFLSIPAIYNYNIEEHEQRSNYLSELLDLTIKKYKEETQELIDFKEEVKTKYKEFVELANKDGIKKLSEELTNRLKQLNPESEVIIDHEPSEVRFIEPSYITRLREFGFDGPISYLGHGLQRSFFFTLLQYLGELRSLEKLKSSSSEIEKNYNSKEKPKTSLILLIIEEPELYQHPNQLKTLKELFHNLTLSEEELTFRFQIICSSHSPYLISMKDIENLRILRKVKQDGDYRLDLKKININSISEKIRELKRSEEKINLKEKLRSMISIEILEAFFAKKIVLVEGLEEKAVLISLNKQLGNESFYKLGISLISASGKNSLMPFYIIFKEFGFPIYLIFDTDSDKVGDKRRNQEKLNKELIKMVTGKESNSVFSQIINNKFASIDPNMTKAIKNEIGDRLYKTIIKELKRKFNINRKKKILRNTEIMYDFIKKVYENAQRLAFLEEIIDKILNL
ncbi:MAG: ATP-dependent nuclease [Promethearchaeota archaeon]